MTATRTLLLLLTLAAACGDGTTTPDQAPLPPADFFATPRTGELFLRWRDVSERETSYRIEVRATASATWQLLQETAADVTTLTHSNVTHGVTYQYRIQACNTSGCSAWIETSGKWDGGQAPAARPPRVTGVGNTFVRVDYDAVTGGLPTSVSIGVRRPVSPFLYQSAPVVFSPRDVSGEFGDIQGSTTHAFNLEPLTDYEVVTIASNILGTSISVATRFRTTGVGLPVLTDPGVFETLVTDSSATVVVTIQLQGSVGEFWIERVPAGSDFSAPTRSNTTFIEPSVGPSVIWVATLYGLTPNTAYHWRGAVKNAAGTAYSEVRNLTTRSR